MKKLIPFLAFSILNISFLNAEDLKNNKTVEVYSSSNYNVALENFRNKKYKESYSLFNELFLNDMGNILINFYLGRSAYELTEYEMAISAYDRILILNPENTRVRLELAQTYMKMELFTQSIKEFEEVLKDEKTPSLVKKQIESKIRVMKDKQKKHFMDINLMAGIIYDSNINATSTVKAFDIYNPIVGSNITINNSAEEKSSTIFQTVSQFNHKYKYSDNYIITNSVTALLMKYKNHKEKDVHAISLSSTPTYIEGDYKISSTFNFDKVNLGHKSYQNNIYLNPSYTRVVNNSLLYELGFKLGKINFVKENERDAYVYEIQNSLKHLTKDYGLFNIGVNIGREKEEESSSTNVDHKYYESYISNSYDFPNNYTLTTSLNYKISNYNDNDVFFQSKRKDKKSDISFTLQKTINNDLLFNLGSSYTNRDSNHVTSDYDKYTIKMNLLWNYNLN